MLSLLAQQFAAEIAGHDWSDAPYRFDRAGHQNATDSNSKRTKQLALEETATIQANVAMVVAQVLKYNDANLDLHEFAAAAGVQQRWLVNSDGRPSGGIPAAIRKDASGAVSAPGTCRGSEG